MSMKLVLSHSEENTDWG